MVETALVALVFFCMLIGALDFGQFLFIHQALTERVRWAARWGAINGATQHDSIKYMVLYKQSTAPSAGTPTYFNLSSSNVSVTDPDSGTNNHRLNVVLSGYKYKMLSPYIAGSYTGPKITVSVPLGPYN